MVRRYVFGRLFAEPSFVGGLSSVVDIGATLQAYNGSASEAEADLKALRNDWRAVGDDLRASIQGYEQEQGAAAR